MCLTTHEDQDQHAKYKKALRTAASNVAKGCLTLNDMIVRGKASCHRLVCAAHAPVGLLGCLPAGLGATPPKAPSHPLTPPLAIPLLGSRSYASVRPDRSGPERPSSQHLVSLRELH